jgi:hypothetical protein
LRGNRIDASPGAAASRCTRLRVFVCVCASSTSQRKGPQGDETWVPSPTRPITAVRAAGKRKKKERENEESAGLSSLSLLHQSPAPFSTTLPKHTSHRDPAYPRTASPSPSSRYSLPRHDAGLRSRPCPPSRPRPLCLALRPFQVFPRQCRRSIARLPCDRVCRPLASVPTDRLQLSRCRRSRIAFDLGCSPFGPSLSVSERRVPLRTYFPESQLLGVHLSFPGHRPLADHSAAVWHASYLKPGGS